MHPLVTADWLYQHLSDDSVKIIDFSAHMPAANRNARADYQAGHIPGAIFWDMEDLSDHKDPLPHMMPTKDQIEMAARLAGINPTDTVIFYDDSAIKTAARGRFMMRFFGHRRCAVLDGGLSSWKAAGYPLEASIPTPHPGSFTAGPPLVQVKNIDDLLDNLSSQAYQVLDARSAARYTGADKEPRAGLRSGHIPGSLNLPFADLLTSEGRYQSPDRIKALYEKAGLRLDQPVITSCGSGVTAAVLALGLELIEKNDVALYDGSWSEWGAHPSTPVQQD